MIRKRNDQLRWIIMTLMFTGHLTKKEVGIQEHENAIRARIKEKKAVATAAASKCECINPLTSILLSELI